MATTFQELSPPLPPTGLAEPERAPEQAAVTLVPSRCFLCGDDDAEPVAVGEDFSRCTGPDMFLAVCCRRCGLVYLNPWPAASERERIRPVQGLAGQTSRSSLSWNGGRAWNREMARFCRLLPKQGRLLDLSNGEGPHRELLGQHLGMDWLIEAPVSGLLLRPQREIAASGQGAGLRQADGAYDAMLAINVLEQEENPLLTLKALRQSLRIGGKILIATPNTASMTSRAFRGRHWSEYDFPRRRNLFNPEVLARSAELAELKVISLRTVADPAVWVESLRLVLVDWGTPAWVQRAYDRSWPILRVAAAVIEWIQQRRGKGGGLIATLQRCSA